MQLPHSDEEAVKRRLLQGFLNSETHLAQKGVKQTGLLEMAVPMEAMHCALSRCSAFPQSS